MTRQEKRNVVCNRSAGDDTAAAGDLATIGSDLSAAHMAAAPTVALVPAAADEVSAGIAQVFSRYAEDYHALAGQAAAFHDQFVHNLTASAGSYASIEAAIASFLQNLNANANQVLNSLSQNLIGNIDVGIISALVAALYVATALHQLLTTGQILTWSAFLSDFLSSLSGLYKLYLGGFIW